jgi:hypothetical protein
LSIRQITEKTLVFQRRGPRVPRPPTLYRDWLWAARARPAALPAHVLLSIGRGRNVTQPFVDFQPLDDGSGSREPPMIVALARALKNHFPAAKARSAQQRFAASRWRPAIPNRNSTRRACRPIKKASTPSMAD